eukprot:XP_017945593.1 PREDICTED: phospholipase A2 inhibitor subunit gamma B-like [Xenopus tropicalis]
MSSTLAPIYTLLAFVATGYSLSCTKCLTQGGTTCSGPSVTCASNEVCASLAISFVTAEMNNVNMFASSCAPQNECDISGGMSFPPSTKVAFASSCCSTDKCTPAPPTLSDANQPNGVVCPACVSMNSDPCKTGDTMKCTGNERMCYSETSTVPGMSGPVSIRGCASKSICDIAISSEASIFKSLNVSSSIKCTNGAFHPHPGFLLPAAIASALITFMLFVRI